MKISVIVHYRVSLCCRMKEKRPIEFKSMTLIMENVFNELFHVVHKVGLSEIR